MTIIYLNMYWDGGFSVSSGRVRRHVIQIAKTNTFFLIFYCLRTIEGRVKIRNRLNSNVMP